MGGRLGRFPQKSYVFTIVDFPVISLSENVVEDTVAAGTTLVSVGQLILCPNLSLCLRLEIRRCKSHRYINRVDRRAGYRFEEDNYENRKEHRGSVNMNVQSLSIPKPPDV